VTRSRIDKVLSRLAGVNHETVGELHAFGTSGTEFSRDDNLAALCTALHDESEDTIASSSDSETVQKFVSEGFALCDGGETTVLDLCGIERNGVLWELESLLDQRGEFANSSSLLAENFLCVGCANDDIGDGGGNADFNTRVSLLGQLTLEELVQFSVEDTISNKLSPLRAVKMKVSMVYL
jgi:hypothetical protein